MEGAEKKGFVCDSGRKPADYNHASACRAPRFAIYDTRDNWDFFFFIFFVPSFFPPSSRFIFQLRFFLQCTSILFWSTHRKKEENLKRTARVNEDGSIGLFSRDESAETVWEKNDPQGWIIHLTFWWSIISQDRCSFMRLSRRFFFVRLFTAPTYGWPVPLRPLRIIVSSCIRWYKERTSQYFVF